MDCHLPPDVIVSVVNRHESADIADGRYRERIFQGKSSEGDGCTRGPFCCVERHGGDAPLWYALAGKRIFPQIADRQIDSGVTSTIEGNVVDGDNLRKMFPALV